MVGGFVGAAIAATATAAIDVVITIAITAAAAGRFAFGTALCATQRLHLIHICARTACPFVFWRFEPGRWAACQQICL